LSPQPLITDTLITDYFGLECEHDGDALATQKARQEPTRRAALRRKA
jgi:hypothetical protein